MTRTNGKTKATNAEEIFRLITTGDDLVVTTLLSCNVGVWVLSVGKWIGADNGNSRKKNKNLRCGHGYNSNDSERLIRERYEKTWE